MYNKVKFYRRRQFVLGPEHGDFQGWERLKVMDNYLLTVHPDLPIAVTKNRENKAILLGYVIDPYHPDAEEMTILEDLIHNVSTLTDIISILEKLTGRFILILKLNSELLLFHDAVALRQVQYCRDEKGFVWCASEPKLLADLLNFNHDEEVVKYREEAYPVDKDEFWIMNDKTQYTQVRNLLPNHCLDLRKGQAFRYWPTAGCIPSLSIEESIKLSTQILQNTIKVAALRFDLWMGMSAGGDSRKTLAAAKEVRRRIKFFTHTPTQASMVSNDVKIPARLLPRLGLKHHNLGTLHMDSEFRKYYENSVEWAREKRGHIAYTLLNTLGSGATVLNSNIDEVAQCNYWLPKSRIDGKNLAIINSLNHPFAISEFQKWLDGAMPACKEAKMNVLDLFFLEQRMGRWATMAFLEYDITHETFNPYNNRYLHSVMLGINERHRRDRRWEVIIKQIKYMWPEVLAEPLNPPDQLRDKIQQFIRRSIVHKTITPWLPIYEYLRYLKLKRRFDRQNSKN